MKIAIISIVLIFTSVSSYANEAGCTKPVTPACEAPVSTGSLWTPSSVSIIATPLFKVGDHLTVNIFTSSISATTANHSTARDISTSAEAGSGWFKGFPGLSASASGANSGAGNSSATTQVVDSLTVTVTQILPNGNLCIEGCRKIRLESDELSLVFFGEVAPRDVAPDYSVSSVLVANQRMESKGKGPIAERQRPGFITRLLSFLW